MKKSIHIVLFTCLFLTFAIVQAQTVKTSLSFDGVNDYVKIPNHTAYNFGTGPFTFEMWIKADTTQEVNPHLLHKKDTITNATGFSLSLNNSGKLLMEIKGLGYSTGFGPGSQTMTDDMCHHIAWTRDITGVSDTLRAYVDGSLVKKSVKAVTSVDITHAADLYVGWVQGGFGKEDFPFNGLIKELRMWNVARTEAQLDDNQDKFLNGNESGLVGYWRFYENSGTTVKDYSTVHNDGALASGGNAPQWVDFCDVINDVIPTGIEKNNVGQLRIYPNPAADRLTVRLDNGQLLNSVRIFNMLGAQVLQNTDATVNTLDVSGLESGIYFCEVILSNGETVTNRFMKK